MEILDILHLQSHMKMEVQSMNMYMHPIAFIKERNQ